jgi:uncharacterized protein
MRFDELMATRPIAGAIAFEGGLLVTALLLALLFGLAPWEDLDLSWQALGVSIGATAPLLLVVWLLFDSGLGWVRELERIMQQTVDAIFQRGGPGGVAAVALAAGFGEEMLFRGVIQAGLSGAIGPWAAIFVAALLFGLAHAISLAYLVAATLIGMYLGAIYQITGNLLIACLVHALYDWVGIHYYLQRRRTQQR